MEENTNINPVETGEEVINNDSNNEFSFDDKDLFVTKDEFKKIQSQNAYLNRKIKSLEEIKQPSLKADVYSREETELLVKGYSNEEIAFLNKNGGKSALEDPFVMSAIEARRQQKEAENAAVVGQGRGADSVHGFSETEIKNMSAEEYKEKVLKQ